MATNEVADRISREELFRNVARAVVKDYLRDAATDTYAICDELYEQADKAEYWDISKPLEFSSHTAEVEAVQSVIEEIIRNIPAPEGTR